MYHYAFQKAKDLKGRYYRDQKTGDLINYCPHIWLIYPQFEKTTEKHADFIPENCNRFRQFQGICQFCGEVIHIYADDVVKDAEEFEKRIDEILKEK